MHSNIIPLRRVFGLILAASCSVIAIVLVAQYGFGLYPCELCLFQRYPYVILIALSILGVLMGIRHPARQLRLCFACGCIFLISAGLGGYHAGVEKNIFKGPTACSGSPSEKPLSIEELRAQILGAPIVSCNDPAWQYKGITMAGLNAGFSLFMAMIVFMQYHRFRKQLR